MKKYKILIGKNVSEFERIARILLANHHVFTRLRRVKTYEGIVELMGQDGVSKAQWFVIGYDKVCKNVVGTMRLAEDEADRYQLRVKRGGLFRKVPRILGMPDDYEDVTIDQYLKIREEIG
jgi:hypothetical protein